MDSVVLCVYNPAHLVRKLRAAGLTLERVENSWQYRINKIVNGNIVAVHGFEFFAALVQRHLMTEEAVVKAIVRTIDLAESGQVAPNAEITMNMLLHWM